VSVLLSPLSQARSSLDALTAVSATPGWAVQEAIDLYKHFDEHHPHVVAGRPLHGPNPWPTQLPGFTETIQQYVRECNRLGAHLMRGISLGLGLEEDYFAGAFCFPHSCRIGKGGSRAAGCCV
jgi:isopenicillin N synthase-like dioxygenase